MSPRLRSNIGGIRTYRYTFVDEQDAPPLNEEDWELLGSKLRQASDRAVDQAINDAMTGILEGRFRVVEPERPALPPGRPDEQGAG